MTSTAEQLQALLRRIIQTPGSLYAERLRHANIRTDGPLDPSVLSGLPLTRRDELLRDQLEHLPHGTRRVGDAASPVRAGISGSGSTLLVLTWTATDLARERAAGARVLSAIGITAGMRVANTLPGALATPGALLLGDVIEEIGALDVPLGVPAAEAAARQAWDLVDRVQPQALVLDAATAGVLFAAAPPLARPWWHGIVWLLSEAAPPAPTTLPPSLSFNGWQRTWLAAPEASSFVAHSCAAGRFHADAGVIVEIVDESGAPCAAGLEGTLALTPLGVDTPVLRYATGLCARTLGTPCTCGAAGVVLELG